MKVVSIVKHFGPVNARQHEVIVSGTPRDLKARGLKYAKGSWTLPADLQLVMGEGDVLAHEEFDHKLLTVKILLPKYQLDYLGAVSVANRNCSISHVVQSLIMDQLDREEAAAQKQDLGVVVPAEPVVEVVEHG